MKHGRLGGSALRGRSLGAWLPAAALLLGLVSYFYPVVTSGFEVVPGGTGDARLVHFSLEHAHRFLSGRPLHRNFWNPPIYYPERNVAAFTDTMIGFAPFYSPFRWLGASPITAYLLWLPTVLALTFVVAYRALCLLLDASRPAATLGAYLFAFAGPRLFNVVHPQMLPWLYWALACLAAGRLLLDPPAGRPADSPGRRRLWLGVLVAALVGQAYGAFYPFFFFVFLAGLGTLVAMTSAEARARMRRLWTEEGPAWALAAAVGALLLAPLAQRYLLTAERVGTRPLESVVELSPRLLSWWMPTPTSRLYGEIWRGSVVLDAPELFGTRALAHGFGVITPILAAIGLWSGRRRPMVRWIVAAVGLLVLLATRWPNDWTLWAGVYGVVPGASAIRAVSRFGHCLLLPAALGVTLLLDRPAVRRRAWPALVIAALVVAEQSQSMRSWDLEPARERVEAIVQALDPSCHAFYLDWSADRVFEEDAMWASLESGVPTVNGRYGNTPTSWHGLRRPSREPQEGPPDEALDAWLDQHCIDPRTVCRLGVDSGSGSDSGSGAVVRRPAVHREPKCAR